MPVILQHEALSWLPALSLDNLHFDSTKKNDNDDDDDDDDDDNDDED